MVVWNRWHHCEELSRETAQASGHFCSIFLGRSVERGTFSVIWYRPRPLRCRGLGVRGILRAEKKHLQTGFRQGGWSNCIPMGLETTKNKNYEPQNRCVFLVQSQRFSVRRALKFRSSQCSFDETMPQQHPK